MPLATRYWLTSVAFSAARLFSPHAAATSTRSPTTAVSKRRSGLDSSIRFSPSPRSRHDGQPLERSSDRHETVTALRVDDTGRPKVRTALTTEGQERGGGGG